MFLIELFRTRFAQFYSTIVTILGLLLSMCVYRSNGFGCLIPYTPLTIATLPGTLVLVILNYLFRSFIIPILEVVFRFDSITLRDWIWLHADMQLLDALLVTAHWVVAGLLTLIILRIIYKKTYS